MRAKLVNEGFSDVKITFTHKINPSLSFVVYKNLDGRISRVDNLNSRIRFPFNVGQRINRNIETWACNNNFLIDGNDPCPEQKIFGVKVSDVPRGYEWRTIFPNKFR
jgi:hypothetical protein